MLYFKRGRNIFYYFFPGKVDDKIYLPDDMPVNLENL